jgi:hypothetical protein
MAIVLDGTSGISTPDLESAGPVTGTTGTFSGAVSGTTGTFSGAVSGTTGTFSGNVTLGSSVLATPTGSAPSYTCRAWVNFDGTGTVAIRASGNVSSITDNGTGNYTVNFTTAMPDENYTFAGSGTRSATDQNPRVLTRLSTQTKTPTAIQLINMASGTTLARDEDEVTVVFLR